MFKIYTKTDKLISWGCSDPDHTYLEVINYIRYNELPKNHKRPILALFESTAKNDETPTPILDSA